MKFTVLSMLFSAFLFLIPAAANCDSKERNTWQVRLANDLLGVIDEHQLEYRRKQPVQSDELTHGVPRTSKQYGDKYDVTRYGVTLYKTDRTSDNDAEMFLRTGFSKFSKQATAGFELIISW